MAGVSWLDRKAFEIKLHRRERTGESAQEIDAIESIVQLDTASLHCFRLLRSCTSGEAVL